MANRTYIRWDDPRVESGAGPEEDKLIHEIESQINTAQRCVFETHRHAFSGTHVKTQGIVKGTLEVSSDLPPHLAQGMFSKPGQYPIAMRYSTETTDLIDDTIPQPRGIGLKIFNVDGPKMRLDGKDPRTQDMEFNSAPALELGNARTCRDIIGLRLQHGSDNEGLDKDLRKRDDYEVQDSRNRIPNIHLVAQRQYSQAPLRLGDYVAKFALVPTSPAQAEAAKRSVTPNDDGATILRTLLTEYYASNEATYDLQAQLLEDIKAQPVEDSRVEWDKEKFPYQTIARVTIPKQDSFIHPRRAFWEDHMRLDPWHGLVEHKPLGSINRVRKGVYKASSALRRRLNSRQEVTITSIDEIPDK